MATVYRISGDTTTDYQTEDEARAAMREPFLGKAGSWVEDRASDGSLKVKFVETTPSGAKKKGRPQSWTVKPHEVNGQ
jgi:hypothetical protein